MALCAFPANTSPARSSPPLPFGRHFPFSILGCTLISPSSTFVSRLILARSPNSSRRVHSFIPRNPRVTAIFPNVTFVSPCPFFLSIKPANNYVFPLEAVHSFSRLSAQGLSFFSFLSFLFFITVVPLARRSLLFTWLSVICSKIAGRYTAYERTDDSRLETK